MTNSVKAEQRYDAELQRLDEIAQVQSRRDSTFGLVRLVTFLLAIVLLGVGYASDDSSIAIYLGWTTFVAFMVAVVANEPVREKLEAVRQERSVIKRLIARTRRDWDILSNETLEKRVSDVELSANQRAVASDLDLTGRSSLFHFVSMAATSPGIRTLVQWLTGPAIESEAISRRTAAEAIVPLYDERIQFYSLAKQIGEGNSDPDRFVAWAAGPLWMKGRGHLMIWANLSAVVSAGLLLAVIAGMLGVAPIGAFKYGLIGLFGVAVLNFIISAAVLGPAHQIFSIAMSSRRSVADYQTLFAAAKWLPGEDNEASNNGGLLRRIREQLVDGEMPADEGMRELQSVASAGALKHSAATFLLYIPLQAFTIWDVRVLARLEKWQTKYGESTAAWFDALGEVEALVSIAAVIDEQADWVMPTWTRPRADAAIKTVQLGHPLLSSGARVCNDVCIGPTGSLLLVTGSNMSGKSTMLRSVGLNVALAGIGAPVCAESFQLPSVEMGTSIRVSDDLSQGVSFYMAELQRLKAVVDHARELESDSSRMMLFLLDEILQGTNSRERQIAVVQVLRHLSDSGAIGAISTHDLELADEDELLAISTTVHFRETIRPDNSGADQMTFDYKMRQGVSPTTNALRLLEIVGLGEKRKGD